MASTPDLGPTPRPDPDGGGGVPSAHHASHEDGGSDEVTLAQSQVTGLTAALAGKADAGSLPVVTTDVAIHVRDTGGAWPLTEMSPSADFAAWETAGGPAWWGIEDGDVVAVNDTITPTRCGIYVYDAGVGFSRHSDFLTVGSLRQRIVSSRLKYSHLNPDPAAAPAGGIPLLGSAEPTAAAADGDAIGSVGWTPQFWVDSWTFDANNALIAAGGRSVLAVTAVADPDAAIPAIDGTQNPIHTTVGDFGTGGDFPIEILGGGTILIPHPNHSDHGTEIWRIPNGPTAWTLEASLSEVGAIGRLLAVGDLVVCTSSDVSGGVFIAGIWVICPTADFSTVECRRLAPLDAAAGTPSMRTLGTGATQAAAGNDPRIVAAAVERVPVTDPNGADITTGDGQAWVVVPDVWTGRTITAVHAGLTTASSSGAPSIQLARTRSGSTVDVLSTAVTIDADELTSFTAATPPVVDTANDDLATGDLLRVDVDAAGTGAKGLVVFVTVS